jgi:lipopolysaccharide exporter
VLRSVIRNSFIRSIGTLTIGTGVAQFIPVLVTPILVRLYSPESFGHFAIFLSLMSILTIPATGKLELSIPIPRSTRESRILMNYNFVWLSVSSILLAGILILIVYLFNLGYFLLILPVAVFLQGLFLILNYWFVRSNNFKIISYSIILKSFCIAGFTMLIAFLLRNEFGLIFGHLFGLLVTTVYLIINSSTNFIFFNWRFLKRFRSLFLLQIDFPKKSVISALTNILSSQTPILFLQLFFSSAITGYYYQAHRLLYAPISLIGTSISKVLYNQINLRNHQNRSYFDLLKTLIKTLFSIIIIPGIIIFFWGPQIFGFILGEEWLMAGKFASLIMPWIFILFIVYPLTVIFEAERKQFVMIKFNLSLLVFRILALYLGYFIFHSAYHSLAFFSIMSLVIYTFILIWLYKLANIKHTLIPALK